MRPITVSIWIQELLQGRKGAANTNTRGHHHLRNRGIVTVRGCSEEIISRRMTLITYDNGAQRGSTYGAVGETMHTLTRTTSQPSHSPNPTLLYQPPSPLQTAAPPPKEVVQLMSLGACGRYAPCRLWDASYE